MQNKVNNAVLWIYISCILIYSGVLFAKPNIGKNVHQLRTDESSRQGLIALTQHHFCSSKNTIQHKRVKGNHKKKHNALLENDDILFAKSKADDCLNRFNRFTRKAGKVLSHVVDNNNFELQQAQLMQEAFQLEYEISTLLAQQTPISEAMRIALELACIELRSLDFGSLKEEPALENDDILFAKSKANNCLSRFSQFTLKAGKVLSHAVNNNNFELQQVQLMQEAFQLEHEMSTLLAQQTPINEAMRIALESACIELRSLDLGSVKEEHALENDDILYARSKADDCLNRFNRFTRKAGKVLSRAVDNNNSELQQAQLMQEAFQLEYEISTLLAQQTPISEAMRIALESACIELRSLDFSSLKEETAELIEKLAIIPTVNSETNKEKSSGSGSSKEKTVNLREKPVIIPTINNETNKEQSSDFGSLKEETVDLTEQPVIIPTVNSETNKEKSSDFSSLKEEAVELKEKPVIIPTVNSEINKKKSSDFSSSKEETVELTEKPVVIPTVNSETNKEKSLDITLNEEQRLIAALVPQYEALTKESETFVVQIGKLEQAIESPTTTVSELNEAIEAVESTCTQVSTHLTKLQQSTSMRRLKELHSTDEIVGILQQVSAPDISDLMKAAQVKAGELGAQKALEIQRAVHNTLSHKANESKATHNIQLNDKGSPIFTSQSVTLDAQGNKQEFLKALVALDDDFLKLLGNELALQVKDDKARITALSPIFNAINASYANNIHKAKGKLLMQPTLARFENTTSAHYKLLIQEI